MTTPSFVLVLSRNERNLSLLADLISDEGCETKPVTSVEEFDAVLRDEASIAIAVLDTEGYTADLWKRCEYLHEREIPIVILTPGTPPHLRREAISRGVRSILEKPVDTTDLRATIRDMLNTD